jgi:hypothetical protein
MPTKIGTGSQIINFNFVNTFVAENMNKILYSTFTPGVLTADFTILPPGLYGPSISTSILIESLSMLIRPNEKDFLVKVDYMEDITVSPVLATPTVNYLVARMEWTEPVDGFDYDTDNLVDILFVAEDDYDSDYDVLLAKIKFAVLGGVLEVNTDDQTRVYLNGNCINYDTVQWSGVSGWSGPSGYSGYSGPRTLVGSDSIFMGLAGWTGVSGEYNSDDPDIERYPGNADGDIPLSNGIMNVNLNAEFLNGYTAGNEDRNIGVKNGTLCENMVGVRLFLSGIDYALGKSGVSGYSAFSGYTGISGWSDASGYSAYGSGYIPLNNSVLQANLNAEFLDGYRLSDFSASGHTHSYDDILDGYSYKKIAGIAKDGLAKSKAIADEALEHRHQSLNTDLAFRYDYLAGLYTAKKMFALAGKTGYGGEKTITFRKVFASSPRVFLLNNETGDWKAVEEDNITAEGFSITHTENTKSDSVTGYLVTDTTDNPEFSSYWIAIGEIS